MANFPSTGVDRFCDKCRRNLLQYDEDGSMMISNMTVMVTRATFGEHGPLEILVTEVKCLKCYPEEG